MAVLLQISQLGHPVLREHATRVAFPLNEVHNNLIENMIATMLDADGVGIAAPQVYQPLDIFIVASRPNPRYPDAPVMEPEVVINPEILAKSTEIEDAWEGCLSIPGLRGLVPRYRDVTVKYQDRLGTEITKTLTGFVARVFQHEFDHLRAIVFLDRIRNSQNIITDREFKRQHINK